MTSSAMPFGMAAMRIDDVDGSSLVVLDRSSLPGCVDMIREGDVPGALTAHAEAVAGPWSRHGLLVPEARMRDADRIRDCLRAIAGAVLEALPGTEFASASAEWTDAGIEFALGCSIPIGEPGRPSPAVPIISAVREIAPFPVMRGMRSWESFSAFIGKPEAGRDLGIAAPGTMEISIEGDVLATMRAMREGRDACMRLGIDPGDVIKK